MSDVQVADLVLRNARVMTFAETSRGRSRSPSCHASEASLRRVAAPRAGVLVQNRLLLTEYKAVVSG